MTCNCRSGNCNRMSGQCSVAGCNEGFQGLSCSAGNALIRHLTTLCDKGFYNTVKTPKLLVNQQEIN